MAPADRDQIKTEELTELLRTVRERVRAQYPEGSTPDRFHVPLPDLAPLAEARDRAESKVASIGKVNPRPGGLANSVVQGVKKLIARALDWHVREQVEFNRHLIAVVEAALETLNEYNRALVLLSGKVSEAHEQLAAQIGPAKQYAVEARREFEDIRSHWAEWRLGWENKLFVNETQFLRTAADLQAGFQHRATLMEANFRDIVKTQHADYLAALARSTEDVQKRFWSEVEKMVREYERVIHEELRIVRQRAGMALNAPARTAAPETSPPSGFDYGKFAEKFRGPEAYVRKSVEIYRQYFEGRRNVLDIGCGRGEFLAMMKEAGVPARGIDLSGESVARCRQQELDAERADLFEYLSETADRTLDGIFCAQVVEHLGPALLPRMIQLCAAKLSPGGIIAIETPNPGCLAIFSTHFYLDPTHTRPVPAPLLGFYLEECGFGRLEIKQLSPANESMPALAGLPEAFREAFFGGLDYCILGTKL